MSPLLDLLAPLVRRFLANKFALSVASILVVAVAIVVDVGQWGLPATVALVVLSLALCPEKPRWHRR
jgi:hypothetical protein